MNEQHKKRQIAKISVFITSIFVIFMSVTYAFITQVLTGEKQVVISAGVLDLVLEEENEITISDALPMYDEVGMIQDDVFVFRLVNKTSNPTNYVLKIQEIQTGTLDKSDVKYGLIKEGTPTIDLVSNIQNGVIDEGTIAGNDTIDYELRLWIDSSVTEISQVQGKFLSLKMTASASQVVADSSQPAGVQLFSEENLGENCKTYNDGTDTFLVGQCSQNYVWYSGKLWRVVLKNNETGAVKMVTDNGMTSLSYNPDGKTAFENSYMDQWLNQEFLPTLHDYEDYLVTSSVWDIAATKSENPSRSTGGTTVTRTIGLLNSYEYYTTYNNSYGIATSSTGYLHNGTYWWLITPYDASTIWNIYNTTGILMMDVPSSGMEVRPSVYLKSEVKISGGTGIESDPYMLEGDIKETSNGITLLSTRYSGEYVTFNNQLYRIVDIENGLTKITAVDAPNGLSVSQFHTSAGVTNFANASIKTDLENYYQGLKTTNEVAYNMIQPNTTWYLGAVAYGANYKSAICASVDTTKSMNVCTYKSSSTIANIGLSRIGEMFVSKISKGKRSSWTLTPSDNSSVWFIDNIGFAYVMDPTIPLSSTAYISMYLKQNVVIAKDNTGNGTYEHPYSIELGA